VLLDISHQLTYQANVVRPRPPYQLGDIVNTSATQFCVGADDADTGEFYADFPTDDGHYLADCCDNATCYGDHYDENYQVNQHLCHIGEILQTRWHSSIVVWRWTCDQ